MNYTSAPSYEAPQTMMQRLQQERRTRLQEHRRRVMQGMWVVLPEIKVILNQFQILRN